MQWLQLDHMQTICTLLQADNHSNTSSHNFYRLDALPGAQPPVSSTEGIKYLGHNTHFTCRNTYNIQIT